MDVPASQPEGSTDMDVQEAAINIKICFHFMWFCVLLKVGVSYNDLLQESEEAPDLGGGASQIMEDGDLGGEEVPKPSATKGTYKAPGP